MESSQSQSGGGCCEVIEAVGPCSNPDQALLSEAGETLTPLELDPPETRADQSSLIRDDSDVPTPVYNPSSGGANEAIMDQSGTLQDGTRQEMVMRKAKRPSLSPEGTDCRKLGASLKKAKMEVKCEQESIADEGSDGVLNQGTGRNRRKASSQVSSPSKLRKHSDKSKSKRGRKVVQQVDADAGGGGADVERQPFDRPEAESMLVADAGSTPGPRKEVKINLIKLLQVPN